jgi:hypothetical protein
LKPLFTFKTHCSAILLGLTIALPSPLLALSEDEEWIVQVLSKYGFPTDLIGCTLYNAHFAYCPMENAKLTIVGTHPPGQICVFDKPGVHQSGYIGGREINTGNPLPFSGCPSP